MNSKKNTGIVILVITILFLAGMFLYREFVPGGGYGYGYGGHMMTGMGGWGYGGFMLVFWGLVLFGLILMINWLLTVNQNEKDGIRSCDALQVLKTRYAKGEIDRETYERMRRELSL